MFILLVLLFPSVVKEDLVGSQGVVFPSVVKEDLVRDPGCCSSLLVKEDQLSWVLYCPGGRVELSATSGYIGSPSSRIGSSHGRVNSSPYIVGLMAPSIAQRTIDLMAPKNLEANHFSVESMLIKGLATTREPQWKEDLLKMNRKIEALQHSTQPHLRRAPRKASCSHCEWYGPLASSSALNSDVRAFSEDGIARYPHSSSCCRQGSTIYCGSEEAGDRTMISTSSSSTHNLLEG
ncbi:hypothetical protein Taro_013206 [Colocasia esculenta]|uniref:Uncharacterized protein n=1 Tax=Colocasia esculenta TaxID=4460 RepID=A0A843UFK8_COLES|nr:hypothetical protein [Colocasia esculenta]